MLPELRRQVQNRKRRRACLDFFDLGYVLERGRQRTDSIPAGS
jgi:hypothetical protein